MVCLLLILITARFWLEMNDKISHMEGLQRTAPDRLGAQSLCVPPTFFLFLWLMNKQQSVSFVFTQHTHTTSWRHNNGCANLPCILPYIFSCADVGLECYGMKSLYNYYHQLPNDIKKSTTYEQRFWNQKLCFQVF